MWLRGQMNHPLNSAVCASFFLSFLDTEDCFFRGQQGKAVVLLDVENHSRINGIQKRFPKCLWWEMVVWVNSIEIIG